MLVQKQKGWVAQRQTDDFFGRQDPKLDFFNLPNRCSGVGKLMAKHGEVLRGNVQEEATQEAAAHVKKKEKQSIYIWS